MLIRQEIVVGTRNQTVQCSEPFRSITSGQNVLFRTDMITLQAPALVGNELVICIQTGKLMCTDELIFRAF